MPSEGMRIRPDASLRRLAEIRDKGSTLWYIDRFMPTSRPPWILPYLPF
ncbi:hypothetical protein NEICINOT_05005 [Neisseria cinerea ATCC 14685]|uniref:Uncharacterized protein n=1 Tax=Neisseria cinerea ATCC 14685 TaxID=546262 RepID=D0W5N6_NEICI|nr:hypothetical protein NEICINOT_05005 [Neisseria cinerea ATCC 14685]